MRIYQSISETIGHTPLVELAAYSARHAVRARLLAKVESLNPAGSIKDRTALYLINEARKSGRINEHTELIEPTSGNTGIGLAMVAATLGLKLTLTLPETMSAERRKMLAAFGANLVLTDGKKGMQGAIDKANELAAANPNSFIPAQFDNPANVKAHYETTGPEIYEDTDGQVDVLVAGVGTGGTITGTGRYLREKKPSVELFAVEPERSPLLSSGHAGPHGIQGIGANFVPKILDRALLNGVCPVSDEDALATGRELACRDGIFSGISAGAALFAATQIGQQEQYAGKCIVVILPDSGDRYLSTALYAQ